MRDRRNFFALLIHRECFRFGRMAKPDPESCTPFLKALADKTRWLIVQDLLSGPMTAGALAAALKVPQYNISKHLRVLRECGIVATTKRGKYIYCQITPAFRQRSVKGQNQIDLGCCVFNFKKSPPSHDLIRRGVKKTESLR